MGEYLVEFYYKTDNRFELKTHANNELVALIGALDVLRDMGYSYWCTSPGFSVRITLLREINSTHIMKKE